MNTVACVHMYRDGLHNRIAADHNIRTVGIMVGIAANVEAGIDFLINRDSVVIVERNTYNQYEMIGAQFPDGQRATYVIETRDVWGS